MIKDFIKTGKIVFDDSHYNEVYGTMTFYFAIPNRNDAKEFLKAYHYGGDISEASAAELSVEVFVNGPEDTNYEACNAAVEMSRTVQDHYEDGLIDDDWRDLNLSNEDIEALFALVGKEVKT